MGFRCFIFVVLAGVLAGQTPPLLAQQAGQPERFVVPGEGFIQIITTTDGSTMVGRITRITDEAVEFATDLGTVTIPRGAVTSLRTVPESSLKGGEYWFPDPNVSRLYFAPTGRMMPKGEGYIADYYLFFPSINYGFTENLSLGGGLSIIPTGNMADQIYFFTPKIGLKRSERLNIAAGALVLKIPGEEDAPTVSVLYGVGTWGGPDRSITLAFGYGMVDTDLADKPMIVIGGEQRFSRRLAFVTENWIIPGIDNALVSYGIRFLTEKFTTDFALLNIAGEDAIFPGIPYIDFVYYF